MYCYKKLDSSNLQIVEEKGEGGDGDIRGVFRALSNMYDGTFLQK